MYIYIYIYIIYIYVYMYIYIYIYIYLLFGWMVYTFFTWRRASVGEKSVRDQKGEVCAFCLQYLMKNYKLKFTITSRNR